MQPPASSTTTDRHLGLWLVGALVAVVGAALARWGAPLAHAQLALLLKLVGLTLAILGLLTVAIATGLRARARSLAEETPSEPSP